MKVNSEPVSFSDFLSTAITNTIPSIFSLPHIRYLDLSFNNFILSKIPTGLSNLIGLAYLNLSSTMFNDSMTTQFTNLTSLTALDLSWSFSIWDYSSIFANLSSTLTIHSGALYTYINRGSLSASNLNWLQQLNNLRELKLSGVDLSESSRSALWAKPISNLSKLRLLDLSNCGISGKVPVEQLLNLTRLSHLFMDFNIIASEIPRNLANLTSLLILDLTRSNLQGHIPYLPQLKGEIPASMMNLSRIEKLLLDLNQLTGQTSPSISNLKSLKYLSLIQNSFHGSIPDIICSISSLLYLVLVGNSFTGNLPDCIGQLHDLRYLAVNYNKMNGTIPSLSSFFHNSTLYMVSLGLSGLSVKVNQLPFPPKFQPKVLSLGSCNLGGTIPNFISNLTQLTFLGLSNNNLSGPIPSWLFNLPNLGYLDISLNKLQGVIPPNIKLKSFFLPTTLNLRNNQLQVPIPQRLENIEALDLSANNFTGYIPKEVGLGNIRYLALSSNNLFGHIPFSLCQAKNELMLLDLSNNNLGGTGPTMLGNCTSLVYLNLGGNKLSGGIPNELQGKYIGVEVNLLAKGLSLQLKVVCTYHNGMDLSCNNLSRSLPSELGLLQGLYPLKLTQNTLSRPHFDTLSRDGLAYTGNNFLCGAPDSVECDANGSPTTESSDAEDIGQWKLVYAIGTVGYVVGFWGLFGVLYLMSEKRKRSYWAAVDQIVARIIRCNK
ncbi:hypothetical protein POUND7_017542 [Theobroma cacao]